MCFHQSHAPDKQNDALPFILPLFAELNTSSVSWIVIVIFFRDVDVSDIC